MHQRSEIPTAYQTFTTIIHTQFHAKIKIFRADCTREYISTTMRSIIQSHGTLFQQSFPCIHEQNRIAERKNHHILETARAMLIFSFVPRIFWAETVLTAVNLINITPSSILVGKTPMSVSTPLLLIIACSKFFDVLAMPSFLRMSEVSYLLDKLSVYYSALVPSTRVIAAMIPWHIIFLYPIMSPSSRTLIIFHIHFKMYNFCRHLIYHLLRLPDFILIRFL